MRLIQLLPIGDLDLGLAAQVCAGLSSEFHARCEIVTSAFDPEPARHPERRQYHSTELLARMASLSAAAGGAHPWRLLGATSLDLYIPTLTFVFGEAQLEGNCAVISSHRLRQEFYGLPPDAKLLRERLLKEAVHELGHTFGLRHCDDYRCAMAPSHSVEWVDLKSVSMCPACRARAAL
jgi:archaemetzincin